MLPPLPRPKSYQQLSAVSTLNDGAACGHSYSNNKVKGLKTFLDNKGMIRFENREYIYNPDFYY